VASVERRKRANGTLSYRVVWRDPDTRSKRSLTFDDRKEADRTKALLDANRQRLDRAVDVMASIRRETPTVAETIERHIGLLTGIEQATRKRYRAQAAKHITPHLGSWPVDQLSRDRIREWVNDLAHTMSPKTLHGIHSLLSAALRTAVESGQRSDNPCRGVRLPRLRTPEMTFLSHAEFAQLAGYVPEHYRPFVRFLAGTGLRFSEAIVLTVGDVDLLTDNPTVRVSKSLKRAEAGWYVGEPKTRRANRTVSLPASLVDELVPLVSAREADEPLFTTEDGSRIHHGNLSSRVWAPAVKAAQQRTDDDGNQIPGALTKTPRIHDLRHSHASWLITAGVDLPTIQRRLGHESITVTVDTYGHLAPDQLSRAALAADRALSVGPVNDALREDWSDEHGASR
jgi:integrase